MKKWNLLRVTGLIAAAVLITFGSVGNFWRTMKTAWANLVEK
ncbi:MAG TPA: hypothetical protein VF837_00950 [Patescibacteria group bacterium]